MTLFQRFKQNREGATAVIFALSLLPIMGLVGGAIDYSRASEARTEMQRALDGAALALASQSANMTDAQLTARAQQVFATLFKPAAPAAPGPVTVNRIGKTIQVSATAAVRTAIMGLFGFDQVTIGSQAQVTWGTNRIELALVLDNTGSMNDLITGTRKIDALKSAANDLLTTLRGVAADPDTVKVSVVPFDTEVRLDTALRNEFWLRWSNPADKAVWTGYVVDRYQPYDTSDAAPVAGQVNTLYPALKTSQWAAYGNLAPVRGLTSLYAWSDFNAIKGTIDGMKPRGNTDIGLGVAWGLATLSKGLPFTESLGAGTSGLKQFMIVLTDGDNTQNRVNGVINTNVGVIDGRTQLACQSAKNAAIEVYTIRLMAGNANLLRGCASSPDKYYDVQNATQLGAAFQAIAREISGTRLTN